MKNLNMTDQLLRHATISGLVLFGLTLLFPVQAEAQMEGPRVYLLAPVDLNVFVGTYMNLSSNYNFSGNIMVRDADINSNVGVLTYMRYFSLGGRFAQLWVAPVWGSVGGSVEFDRGRGAEVIHAPTISGMADPYIAMRVGLVGAPALKMGKFMKHKQGFQLYGLLSAYVPVGSYSSSRPLNLGTNRWAVRFGLPMVVPFGSPGRATYLEIIPSLNVFTDNDDPYDADVRRQDPLLSLESHLSHNFTSKLWGSVDLRYQNGGETVTDRVPDDNRIGQLGAGLSLGYSFTPAWSIQATYGEIAADNNDGNGRDLRIRLSYAF